MPLFAIAFPAFDPVAISLGPLAIRWYALAYIAGLVLGWRWCLHLADRPPRLVKRQDVDDFLFWATLGVVLGGRLGYVLFYKPSEYFAHPAEIVKVWHGGMSFHGGALGVIVAIALFCWRRGINVLAFGDIVVCAVPIGLFFGRIANFINGELWGRPTNAPWGMVFCSPHIAAMNQGQCPAGLLTRHPSQLYEAGLEGIVLFLVLLWATHKARWLNREGAITGLFLTGYGLARVALENVRQPDAQMPDFPLGLTMGMMLSIPMILTGLWLIWRGLHKPPAPPAPETEPQSAALVAE